MLDKKTLEKSLGISQVNTLLYPKIHTQTHTRACNKHT